MKKFLLILLNGATFLLATLMFVVFSTSLWWYASLGMEFFAPGDGVSKFIYRSVAFASLFVYCGWFGAMIHKWKESK